MQNRVCRCLSRVFIAFACFTAGCFETETALGPVEHASVDARLVGDFKTGENGSEDIIVRNFNGREYYIEQRTSGRETACYAGFVVAVKEASFVHVRPLEGDGTLAKKHVILRVDRVDDAKVHLRQLNDSSSPTSRTRPGRSSARPSRQTLRTRRCTTGEEPIVLTRVAK